jgi:hypothetical protein
MFAVVILLMMREVYWGISVYYRYPSVRLAIVQCMIWCNKTWMTCRENSKIPLEPPGKKFRNAKTVKFEIPQEASENKN